MSNDEPDDELARLRKFRDAVVAWWDQPGYPKYSEMQAIIDKERAALVREEA